METHTHAHIHRTTAYTALRRTGENERTDSAAIIGAGMSKRNEEMINL